MENLVSDFFNSLNKKFHSKRTDLKFSFGSHCFKFLSDPPNRFFQEGNNKNISSMSDGCQINETIGSFFAADCFLSLHFGSWNEGVITSLVIIMLIHYDVSV